MTEKKKRSRKGKKWISLDSMMGKALCILLVVILTVGAFMAPKMINNLYDAGTLMQITYMDLDLSTYAVAYTSFPEKIEAIARARAAQEKLLVLPSEETDGEISDEELIEITNGEMEELKNSLVMLFWEEWWSGLTEENLVSREKNTLYAQPGGTQDGAAGSEMPPVQFWMLTFELTEDRKAVQEEEYRTEKDTSVVLWSPEPAAEKLIVCLDADFYKIYAVGIEGTYDRIWMQYEMYGWEFPNIFGVTFLGKGKENYVEEMPDYIREQQMYLIDNFLVDWAEYWGVRPADDNVYGMDTAGEMVGYMILPNEKGGAENSADAEQGTNMQEVAEADDSGAGNISYAGATENKYTDVSVESEYADWSGGKEMLLAVGCSGQWSGEDDELWIQRAGCREFFEMMQF